MVYAPIIIPTMCRYEHFCRLIESLKKNSWAKHTDVYIGLDYPPSPIFEDGYNKICNYLENEFTEFASLTVFKRKENVGTFKNIHLLREEVLSKYDRFIKTDDDAEFSPNFIEYMDKCLMEYESDENVFAVTGYSYPIKWGTSEGATVLKENFSCPMWGTGFWKEKYKKVFDYVVKDKGLGKDADYIIKTGTLKRMLDVSQHEFVSLCLSPEFENTLAARFSDISVRMYTAAYDKYIIVPTTSKVRNWGFDGSGEYCQEAMVEHEGKATAKNYVYHQQPIDTSDSFELIEDTLNAKGKNKDIMDAFDVLPISSKIKMQLKLFIYKLIGKENFHKLTYNLRRFKKLN